MRSPTLSASWSLRRVIPQHEHGCGIACVAMLAGVSYATACFDIFGDGEGDATSLSDLCWALRDYGLRVARHATPFWAGSYTQLRQPALLIMNPDRFDTWHAAVWDAEHRRILDPLPRPAKRPVVVGYVEVAHGAARCANRVKKPANRAKRRSEWCFDALCRRFG